MIIILQVLLSQSARFPYYWNLLDFSKNETFAPQIRRYTRPCARYKCIVLYCIVLYCIVC